MVKTSASSRRTFDGVEYGVAADVVFLLELLARR